MAKLDVHYRKLKASHARLRNEAKSCKGTPSYLLLFYATECGLKHKLLKFNHFEDTSQLDPKDLNHNLHGLVKKLKIPSGSILPLPSLRPKRPNGSQIDHADAHQAWRYGIDLNEDDQKQFIQWLEAICGWLEKQV